MAGSLVPTIPESAYNRPACAQRARFSAHRDSSRPLQEERQLLQPEGLGQVVVGALADGVDGRLDRAVRGHHDHRTLGREATRGGDQLQPIDAGHPQVGDQGIDGSPSRAPAPPPRADRAWPRNPVGQTIDQRLRERELVIHHQYPATLEAFGLMGPPGELAADGRWRGFPAARAGHCSVPWWLITISLVMARPSPVPRPGSLVVKKGSFTRAASPERCRSPSSST